MLFGASYCSARELSVTPVLVGSTIALYTDTATVKITYGLDTACTTTSHIAPQLVMSCAVKPKYASIGVTIAIAMLTQKAGFLIHTIQFMFIIQ